MSAKHAINNKLQGSVATYLRYGGVVNNQIKKGLLLSLRVKNVFKSVNIWQSYQQERDCLVHFFSSFSNVGQARKVHETITFLLVALQILTDFNFFSLRLGDKPFLICY